MADKNVLSVKIKGQDAGLLPLLKKERAEFERLGGKAALDLRKELDKLARSNKKLSATAKKGKPIWGRFAQGIALGNIAANAATAIFSGMARAIKAGFAGILQAGADSEKVWMQTTATLERHGIEVNNNVKAIKDFADEMQTATGVSDEEFAKSINNLIDRGLNLRDAMDIVSVSVDIAASKNKNATKVVNEFADAIGKKDLLALEKYGIALDTTADFTDQLGKATGELQAAFGGAAAAASEGVSVQMDLLGQSFGDLQEQVFFKFQPVITEAFSLLIDIVKEFTAVLTGVDLPTDKAGEFTDGIDEAAQSLRDMKLEVQPLVQTIVSGFGIAIDAVVLMNESISLAQTPLRTFIQTAKLALAGDFAGALGVAGIAADLFTDALDGIKTSFASLKANIATFSVAQAELGTKTGTVTTGMANDWRALQITIDQTIDDGVEAFIEGLETEEQALATDLANKLFMHAEADAAQLEQEAKTIEQREEAEKASAERRRQIEEQFAAEAGAITGRTAAGLISSFDSVNKSAEEIWKDMFKDFSNLLLQKMLTSLLPGGSFVTGFLGAFKFWDVAANDRALIREGDRAAMFITQGITEGLQGFAPNVQASSVVNAVLGVRPNRIDPVSQSSMQSVAPIQIIVTDSGMSTSDRFTNPRGLVSSVITRLARSQETLVEQRTRKRFTDPNPFAAELL